MRSRLFFYGLALAVLLAAFIQLRGKNLAAAPTAESGSAVPVLVELFTSEGCSDCPPADALLARLEEQQPIAGAQVIALSEHVTYWDQQGWKDPFSEEIFTQRQEGYAAHFGLGSVYTPQMVVDGAREFVGSDERRAQRAIADAARANKLAIRVSSVRRQGDAAEFTLEIASPNPAQNNAQAYVAVAQAQGSSEVRGGENSGHTLHYTSIARVLAVVGRLRRGQPFHQEIRLPLGDFKDTAGLRLIVFVQQPSAGPILGATAAELN